MTAEAILLTSTRIQTLQAGRRLTNATGFFFEREGGLFLVTCRHVLVDSARGHHPDQIEIELHLGDERSTRTTRLALPLFHHGVGTWRTCSDAGGDVDVAAIPIARENLPPDAFYRAFTPQNLVMQPQSIEVGQAILVVGFPLGFQDNLHHLPVVRQAAIASSFGLRFEGRGYFLTDARTHRGTSGAPVVMRIEACDRSATELPWRLLGVHSARLEADSRDLVLDEALGLNCAWYADALVALTDEPGA